MMTTKYPSVLNALNEAKRGNFMTWQKRTQVSDGTVRRTRWKYSRVEHYWEDAKEVAKKEVKRKRHTNTRRDMSAGKLDETRRLGRMSGGIRKTLEVKLLLFCWYLTALGTVLRLPRLNSDQWTSSGGALNAGKKRKSSEKWVRSERSSVASCDTRVIRASDKQMEGVTRTLNGSLINSTVETVPEMMLCRMSSPQHAPVNAALRAHCSALSPSIHPRASSFLSHIHSLIRLLPETVRRFPALLRHFDIYNSRAFESRSNGFSRKRVSLLRIHRLLLT